MTQTEVMNSVMKLLEEKVLPWTKIRGGGEEKAFHMFFDIMQVYRLLADLKGIVTETGRSAAAH